MMKPEYLDVSGIISDTSVLKAFEAVSAFGGVLRFVGGAVRDSLAGLKGFEIDLATDLTPDELVEACTEQGLKTVSLGLKFAKTGVVIDGKVFEISSLHKSIKASDKDSDLSFTDDWNADASTRDLTINAVYADEHGNVFDYYNGINDLEKGIVRFIGSADQKIQELPIRILRFFRFYSLFGKTKPDATALKACIENKELLKTLSADAIKEEFFKILMTKNASVVIKMLNEHDILSFLLPETCHAEHLSALDALIHFNEIEADAIRRLFVLFQPDPVVAESLALRFHLNKAQKTRLINLSKFSFNPLLFDDLKYIKRVLFSHGKEFVKDKILIALAQSGHTNGNLKNLFHQIDMMETPVFPLSGKDLIKLGITEGAPIKEIIGTLKNIWIESDFELSTTDLQNQAKKMMKIA